MESLTNLPEVQEIEQAKSKFLTVALSTKVIDHASLELGNQLFLQADSALKAIDDKLDPKRELAYRAYQEWLKLIKELKDPYLKAKAYLNGQIVDYKREQDRKRDEEQERLRQEALKAEAARRKEEEDRKTQEAADLEAAGLQEEAQALVDEVIEDIGKPVEVYVPPPETAKVKLDGASIRETWSAQVTDLRALCRAVADGKAPLAYIEANMTALNAQARSLKKELNIPGVKSVSSQSMSATGRRAA